MLTKIHLSFSDNTNRNSQKEAVRNIRKPLNAAIMEAVWEEDPGKCVSPNLSLTG